MSTSYANSYPTTRAGLTRPALPTIPTDAILSAAAEIEAGRRLPTALVDALTEADLFRLYTPREHGGLELDPVDLCSVVEEVSAVDGSVGWCVWNGNCGFAAALLEPDAAAHAFGLGEPVGNSARVAGGAVPVEGGYRLTGRWDLVSGSDHQPWIILFGVVMAGDIPRQVGPDVPDVRAFLVQRDQFTIIDKWHVLGLRGSASNEVVVQGAFIPEDYAPAPFAPTRINRTLYRVPIFTTASCAGAAVCLGIARGAIDDLVRHATTSAAVGDPISVHPSVQAAVAESDIQLRAARAALHDALRVVTATAAAGLPAVLDERGRVRAAMTNAARTARSVTIRMFEQAGSAAIYHASPLQQRLRDVMVASQHMMLQPRWYEQAGRAILGLEPTMPAL
jgi:indole-3-acetate monooxygenase